MGVDKKRSFLGLLALAVSAFAIGTTEFISVGLLPLISEDLNISVKTAGLTVSLYALGVTLGAPILTSLTSMMSRKSLLLWIMVVFIIGNSLAASATSVGVLLAARVISAFSHGVFMSIGSTIAANLVPENKESECDFDYVYRIDRSDRYGCTFWNVSWTAVRLENRVFNDCGDWHSFINCQQRPYSIGIKNGSSYVFA